MKKKLLLLLFALAAQNGFSQDNYLDFDGVNDNVVVSGSDGLLSNLSTISMSCKVYPKNANPSFPDFDGFAGYRNDSNFDFYLIQLSATEVEARFRNSSGTTYTLTYDGLVLNEWNHFFLVYDGSYLTLYSGADEVASIEADGTVPGTNTSLFRIGNIQYSITNFYYKGYIDEVSLWQKALTGSEISSIIYNGGEISEPSSETDLLLYYKFNQGNAYSSNAGLTTLTDEQGILDGTLSNFALTGSASNWGGEESMSIDNFDKTNQSLYPNPVSDIINFSGFSEINSIKIVDLSGRTIVNQNTSGSQLSAIDVSQLNPGVHFAIINETQNMKFIKK